MEKKFIYNVFRKSKEQLEEEAKAEEAREAEEDSDDDDFWVKKGREMITILIGLRLRKVFFHWFFGFFFVKISII